MRLYSNLGYIKGNFLLKSIIIKTFDMMNKVKENQEILSMFGFPIDNDMKLFKPLSSVSMWDIKNYQFESRLEHADRNLFVEFRRYVRMSI